MMGFGSKRMSSLVIEGYQLPDPEIEKHDFIKKPYIELIRS